MDNTLANILIFSFCCLLPVILLFRIFASIWVLPEYERAVLIPKRKDGGTQPSVKGPGFVVINPLTTRAYKVDLREKQKLQESDTISKPDNTKIKIQTRWAYRIMDPVKAVSVPNIDLALEGMLTISLRDLVQNKPLASIQNEQIQIEADLRTRMNDSIGERWGVKILQTELVKISKVTLEID